MSVRSLIKSLQRQPYETRLRLLWAGSLASIIVVGAAWVGLTRLSPALDTSGLTKWVAAVADRLHATGDGLSQVGGQVKSLYAQLGLPSGYSPVSVQGTQPDPKAHTLTINFQVNNPSADIFDFAADGYANITLTDGSRTLPLLAARLTPTLAFPHRVLGKSTYPGQLIFAQPASDTVTLNIQNMYFEMQPGQTFSQNIDIPLTARVKGASTLGMPRAD